MNGSDDKVISDGVKLAEIKFSSYPIRRDESLLKTFDSLLLNKQLSDVTFVVEGTKIAAHRFLLAARSSVFEAMFYGPLKSDTETVTITDCYLDIFQTVLMYIYTNDVDIHKNNVIPVMITAHKYDLSFLEAKCENFLSDCNDFEEIIQHFDVLYDVDAFFTLKKSLVKKIKENITGKRKRDLFLHISTFETLKYLLDEIITVKCNDEGQFNLDLFEMLIVWATKQCEENLKEITAGNIRDSLCGLEQLLDMSKLNRQNFAKCQEMCPSFFNSSELKSFYENLSPDLAENKKKCCRYCLKTMSTFYCCGYQQ